MPRDRQIARHRTAISRKRLSRPVARAVADGIITKGRSVLDFGCGRGDDVRLLRKQGIRARGWDPHFAPDGDDSPADVVVCSYVANVIEDPRERDRVLRRAWKKARKAMVVAVRSHGELRCREDFADGCLTSIGTFQRGWTDDELQAWIQETLRGADVEIAVPGVAFVRPRYRGTTGARSAPASYRKMQSALSRPRRTIVPYDLPDIYAERDRYYALYGPTIDWLTDTDPYPVPGNVHFEQMPQPARMLAVLTLLEMILPALYVSEWWDQHADERHAEEADRPPPLLAPIVRWFDPSYELGDPWAYPSTRAIVDFVLQQFRAAASGDYDWQLRPVMQGASILLLGMRGMETFEAPLAWEDQRARSVVEALSRAASWWIDEPPEKPRGTWYDDRPALRVFDPEMGDRADIAMSTTWAGRFRERYPVREGVMADLAWRTTGASPSPAPNLPSYISNAELADWLLRNSATDAFGELDYNDARDIAGAAESGHWILELLLLETLPSYLAAPKPVNRTPIVVAYGDVLDGRHRVGAANARGETHIWAYVPDDEGPGTGRRG